jgi:hypothetical protein
MFFLKYSLNKYFIFLYQQNKYLDFIMDKISKYSISKTIVVFGINMLYEEDCTIDGDNLREYSSEKDMLFMPFYNTKTSFQKTIFSQMLL